MGLVVSLAACGGGRPNDCRPEPTSTPTAAPTDTPTPAPTDTPTATPVPTDTPTRRQSRPIRQRRHLSRPRDARRPARHRLHRQPNDADGDPQVNISFDVQGDPQRSIRSWTFLDRQYGVRTTFFVWRANGWSNILMLPKEIANPRPRTGQTPRRTHFNFSEMTAKEVQKN